MLAVAHLQELLEICYILDQKEGVGGSRRKRLDAGECDCEAWKAEVKVV